MGGVGKKKEKEELGGAGNKRICRFSKDSRPRGGKDDTVCAHVCE